MLDLRGELDAYSRLPMDGPVGGVPAEPGRLWLVKLIATDDERQRIRVRMIKRVD